MSIGLVSGSIAGSAAGTSLAQTRGSDIDRTQQESSARDLRTQSAEKAESAAGVGETDGDNHQTAERDADGRRPWEFPRRQGPQEDGSDAPPRDQGRDPTGQSGSMLDLSG
jgi:hypothetical protein